MLDEIWRDITGYANLYQVSNFGRVRSLGNGGTHKNPRILSQKTTNFGYKTVSLSKNGVQKEWRVHRLVALMFVPNICGHSIVNHIDGDKTNNYATNLEWCTQSHNAVHAYENNLHVAPSGESHWNCKLTDQEVKSIREEYVKYDSQHGSAGLAKKYNVCSRTIRDIVGGRRRKGVAN